VVTHNSRRLKPRLVAATALLFLAVLQIARIAAFQTASRGPAPNAPLFSAFLWGEKPDPPALQLLEPAARDALETRLRARLAYKPILTVPLDLSYERKISARIQQRFEGMLATLSGRPDLGKEAASAAPDVGFAYEWEGFSDGPMGEAADAEEYLAKHPKTALAPGLNLLILHRYRCAFEAATFNKEPEVQAKSAARYRAAWERLGHVQDVVVQALARDIDESPYVYMEEIKLHPRTFKGAQK
jgi:hypothetical protein